ncbi:MAG: PhoH family protein [Acidimicrobiia bacterium]
MTATSVRPTGGAVTDLLAQPTSTLDAQGGDHRALDPGPLEQSQRCCVVLDTSVLIADPGCLHNFDDVDVVVPLTVIEELDGLKSRMDDDGRAARAAQRSIEELRVAAGGSLAAPVPTGAGTATERIEINGIQRHLLTEHGLDANTPDTRIIGAALGQSRYATVRLVSNDAALRIKAAHLGLDAHEHSIARADLDRSPSGWTSIDADAALVNRLFDDGTIDVSEVDALTGASALTENTFAVIRSGKQSALVRRRGDDLAVLAGNGPEAWGLRARSKEQRFALELLLDPDVSVVALDGRAGTGKTILAVAAGLELVVEKRRFERLAVYRPLVPVGRADVGFLPGGLEEKLDPWMSAIHDAIVALTERRSHNDARRLIDELTDTGRLSLESVTFLRGRSLHRQIVVVDEAQNLEPTTLKTILTRVGEGTKIIFTGDTSQIDAPYVGESNNALAVLISTFAGRSLFGHMRLAACERSEVASLAAELL